MKIYDGGSDKDFQIWRTLSGGEAFNYESNEWEPSSKVTSKGNQIFITFNTDAHEVDIGFTAKITFGIRTKLYNAHTLKWVNSEGVPFFGI